MDLLREQEALPKLAVPFLSPSGHVIDVLVSSVLWGAAILNMPRHCSLAVFPLLVSVVIGSVVSRLVGLDTREVLGSVLDVIEAFPLYQLILGRLDLPASSQARTDTTAVEVQPTLTGAVDVASGLVTLLPALSALVFHSSLP